LSSARVPDSRGSRACPLARGEPGAGGKSGFESVHPNSKRASRCSAVGSTVPGRKNRLPGDSAGCPPVFQFLPGNGSFRAVWPCAPAARDKGHLPYAGGQSGQLSLSAILTGRVIRAWAGRKPTALLPRPVSSTKLDAGALRNRACLGARNRRPSSNFLRCGRDCGRA